MCNSVWGSIGQQAVQIEGSVSQLKAADARRRLAEGLWPAVVLEAALCGGDADELVGALADARFEGAIVVLGTTVDIGERIALLGRGPDDYIALPYDLGEFVARIAALLRRVRWRVGKPNGLHRARGLARARCRPSHHQPAREPARMPDPNGGAVATLHDGASRTGGRPSGTLDAPPGRG